MRYWLNLNYVNIFQKQISLETDINEVYNYLSVGLLRILTFLHRNGNVFA